MITFLSIGLAYIIGSIPFGLVIAWQVKGIDIRQCGSGNIGATNVTRVVGKKWGVLVFILDFLKGFLPVSVFSNLFNLSNWTVLLTALASILGHTFSLFLKGKGGKGVATSLGSILAITIKFNCLKGPFLVALVGWYLAFKLTRIVSIASLVSIFIFSLGVLIICNLAEVKIFTLIILVIIIIRHRKNIINLIKNKEYKF